MERQRANKVCHSKKRSRALIGEWRRKTPVIILGKSGNSGRESHGDKKNLRRAVGRKKLLMMKLKKVLRVISKFLSPPPPPKGKKLLRVEDDHRRFMTAELSHSMSSFLI